MLRWFRRLMPQEERFFDMYARHADTVVRGAEALRGMLNGGEAVQRHYPAVLVESRCNQDVTGWQRCEGGIPTAARHRSRATPGG